MAKSAISKKVSQKKAVDPRNTGRSALNLALDSKESRRGYDALWDDAAHAPMFCRTKKVPDKDGKMKTVRRTTRLISSTAFKIAAEDLLDYIVRPCCRTISRVASVSSLAHKCSLHHSHDQLNTAFRKS